MYKVRNGGTTALNNAQSAVTAVLLMLITNWKPTMATSSKMNWTESFCLELFTRVYTVDTLLTSLVPSQTYLHCQWNPVKVKHNNGAFYTEAYKTLLS
jgi:hypothetical protein